MERVSRCGNPVPLLLLLILLATLFWPWATLGRVIRRSPPFQLGSMTLPSAFLRILYLAVRAACRFDPHARRDSRQAGLGVVVSPPGPHFSALARIPAP
jgi:hypothetical protein